MIVNPIDGQKYKLNNNFGRMLLKMYIMNYKTGGSSSLMTNFIDPYGDEDSDVLMRNIRRKGEDAFEKPICDEYHIDKYGEKTFGPEAAKKRDRYYQFMLNELYSKVKRITNALPRGVRKNILDYLKTEKPVESFYNWYDDTLPEGWSALENASGPKESGELLDGLTYYVHTEPSCCADDLDSLTTIRPRESPAHIKRRKLWLK